jgi:hypothetical protein
MREETNSILYQRTQNDWSKISVYALKLLPKLMKQVTKCHARQVYLIVGRLRHWVASLDFVCVCVCGGGCVRVLSVLTFKIVSESHKLTSRLSR